ncbi:MAG: hypothetical protein KF757_09890 [Phycisphaeraceae bacterium]|nr:hypothetical protein [Phycisphaeraceae bacterium]MCW5763523.1 hypothetical protein [Phycisphaeraceae bacterium]
MPINPVKCSTRAAASVSGAALACAALALACGSAAAQPTVPNGFSARLIAPVLDGVMPELSAIDHPSFGSGVVSATVANNIATFRLISPSGVISNLGTFTTSNLFNALSIHFDHDNIIAPLIHATLYRFSPGRDTLYLTIAPGGQVTQRWILGASNNQLMYNFALTDGSAGNPVGAVLLDRNASNGTVLARMDTDYQVTVVAQNSVPSGRVDTDVWGMQRDVTGLYGGGVLIADSDDNDQRSAIYEMRNVMTGGTYRQISNVHWNTLRYGDLAIVAGGDFGGVIYITDTLSNQIQQVATDGTHTMWASGFTGLDALAISHDGMSMYAADASGIWLIRATGTQPGPVILATDPSIPASSHLTGGPVSSARIIFNEAVSFTQAHISIVNSANQNVGFAASGSGSQFMLLSFAQPLKADTYTVTISDAVLSVATGEPLDGNNDGTSGGDAVVTFKHFCLADTNTDRVLDFFDVQTFLNAYSSQCQ